MIGIGITEYNRYGVFKNTLDHIQKYLPDNYKLVVVDDGSDMPVFEADYRFEKNVGTPIAKNKCLELLKDCEHIFLFDSDTYPIVDKWWLPYVESKHPHLNFTFKYPKKEIDAHYHYENPNGCMMYIHNSVLNQLGGFDPEFKFYGYWHGAFSNRVFNSKMIPHPFIDVIGSDKLFCSMDNEKTVSTSRKDRSKYLRENKRRYYEKIYSKEFISFESKPKIFYSNPYNTEKNIGKALNDFCKLVPDDAWICLQDGDIMYLTPDWGKQIEQVIINEGSKYDLFGCVTNRLGRNIQKIDGMFEEMDISKHFDKAKELSQNNFAEVEDITRKKYVAGMFMLFKKSTWNKVKFKENCIYFDDEFSKDIIRSKGRLGLIKGLYVLHLYRIWSDNAKNEKTHLL